MSFSVSGTTREDQALAEIARTAIAEPVARALVAAFLLMLLAGGALEVAAAAAGRPNLLRGKSALDLPRFAELRELWRAPGPLAAANRLKDAGIEARDRLDRESQASETIRPPLQSLLSGKLRYGNSQVLIGDQGWLFFRDEFDYLTGPPFLAAAALARRANGLGRHPTRSPNPLPALLGLAEDLRQRGIGLVILPVPTKLGIAWERFLGRDEREGPALANPSRDELVAELRRAGVTVFDPSPILREMELRDEEPYMQFDSHWSPAAIDRVAAGLAQDLAHRFELGPIQRFHRQERPFERRADLADLLGLAPDRNPYLLEPLTIQMVDGPGERPFSARRGEGQVLLVGDSFSRLLIRNRRKGGDANFAAQLSFHLLRPVDMVAENDAGTDFARRVDWLRQPHELDDRSVVVFEFAERALALGDWTPTRLGPVRP